MGKSIPRASCSCCTTPSGWIFPSTPGTHERYLYDFIALRLKDQLVTLLNMLKLHPKRRWLFTYHKTNQNCVDTLVQNQGHIHGRSTDAPQRAGSETWLTSFCCYSFCYVARPRCCLWNNKISNIWYANLLIYRRANKLLKWTFYKIIQTNNCFSLRLSCNLKKTCLPAGLWSYQNRCHCQLLVSSSFVGRSRHSSV